MNAEAITAKILEEAKAAASETLREAGDKAAKIRDAAEAEAQKARKQAQVSADAQAAQLRERMLRMAELDQKKALLTAKRALIDASFDDALLRMRNMPADQKRAFIKRLLLEASEHGETLIVDEAEIALFDRGFLEALNKALSDSGRKVVTLAPETRKLGGGFVLKDGGMEINCTYQAVLAQMRPTLEAAVAGMLFA